MTHVELRRDLVILACAISAGIHGALVPDHFTEGRGAGLGFAVAALMLAALAVAITLRPASGLMLAFGAAILGGLLVSYALASTTGLPVLRPHAEPVDGLGIATKAIEAVGLLAACSLIRPRLNDMATRGSRPIPLLLTALVAFFSSLAVLAVSNDTHGDAQHDATAPAPVID